MTSVRSDRVTATTVGVEGGDILCALSQDCFPKGNSEAWSDEQLRSALTLPGIHARVFHTTHTHDAVGFWLGRFIVDEAELLLIATHPTSRRQGCGRFMLQDFLQSAMDLGCSKAFLEVRESNLPARGLYESCSFEIIGRRRGYYRSPSGALEDALNMRCALRQK